MIFSFFIFYNQIPNKDESKARITWIVIKIIANQTKYLCNLLLNLNLQNLLNTQHVSNINKKESPANIPDQNTSVLSNIKVTIFNLLFAKYALNNVLLFHYQ